jgi:hypothetical protein
LLVLEHALLRQLHPTPVHDDGSPITTTDRQSQRRIANHNDGLLIIRNEENNRLLHDDEIVCCGTNPLCSQHNENSFFLSFFKQLSWI